MRIPRCAKHQMPSVAMAMSEEAKMWIVMALLVVAHGASVSVCMLAFRRVAISWRRRIQAITLFGFLIEEVRIGKKVLHIIGLDML